MKKLKNMKKSHFLSLTFPLKSETIYLVMRDNERAIREGIRKGAAEGKISASNILWRLKPQVEKPRVERFVCWNCESSHPADIAKDWGSNQVCPDCELYLFDEAEKREKRRW
jgi:hypothetical protein